VANSTILALLQNTLQGMGVAAYGQPSTVIANTNQDIVQVLALVNAECDALAHERDWQAQSKQHIFSTPYYSRTGNVSADTGNYLALPGADGDYASTPDSTDLGITGDIEIITYVQADDYTALQTLCAKAISTTNQYSWEFKVQSTGTLLFKTSATGGTPTLSNVSTVALSTTNGVGVWLRVTLDVDDGGGNRVAKFYTSSDAATTAPGSVSWTQLGSTVTTATTASIFDSTSPLEIGSNGSGDDPFDGRIYKTFVYNGIGGTLVASFDADDAPAGSTTVVSSGTGETYTLQGNAALTEIAYTITNISSTVGIATNPTFFQVSGVGIPQDCFVTAVNTALDTVTINQPATATGTGVTLTFNQIIFPPPADFDRQVDRTHWDKSKHWEMLGPSTPQQREWLRSGYISTGPRVRYSYMGGYFMIWPPLGTNESLSYEYVSKYWVLATSPTTLAPTKQAFTVDTDTCIFPDALIRALIKLKYFEVKGFDTTAYYRDYTQQRDLAKANDSGSQTLAMNPRPASILIGWENIPDSQYGQ
jgi:hypothetical protein